MQLQAVGAGETLARRAPPVLWADVLAGRCPPPLGVLRCPVRASGDAALVEVAAAAEARTRLARAGTNGAAVGARRSPADRRAILVAIVDHDVDRAATFLRQPIARNVARLAATEASG